MFCLRKQILAHVFFVMFLLANFCGSFFHVTLFMQTHIKLKQNCYIDFSLSTNGQRKVFAGHVLLQNPFSYINQTHTTILKAK